MKPSLCVIAIVALATLLAACHRGNAVSFDGKSISLHADDQPTATITSRGSFSVGAKAIDVTPAQRQLLLRYYDRVKAIHDGADALKDAGLHIAGKSLKAAGHSVAQAVGIASGSSTADKATAEAIGDEGKRIGRNASHLCTVVQQTKALQATLGREIPAFKPYGDLDPAPDVSCHQRTTINGVTTTG